MVYVIELKANFCRANYGYGGITSAICSSNHLVVLHHFLNKSNILFLVSQMQKEIKTKALIVEQAHTEIKKVSLRRQFHLNQLEV